MEYLENHTFDEITIGDSTKLIRTIKNEDIQLFAIMSGDVNPAHVDPEYAKNSLFHGVVAHGMWSGALISTVLGTQYPGPGTIYLDQTLHFSHPVRIGDTITVNLTVLDLNSQNHHVTFDCQCINQEGIVVTSGTAKVLAPTKKISRPRIELPTVRLNNQGIRYRELMRMANTLTPIRVAVVHPCDPDSLMGAIEACRAKLIIPILVGPLAKIHAAAALCHADLSAYTLIDTPHSHAAAEKAVELARSNQVDALMKGSLHTDELMAEVVSVKSGLHTGRRFSHVFVMDVPSYPRPLFITDAAINLAPNLEEKRDIVQNAIDLAHVLGITKPKVAILSAVETVTEKLRSTLDAAALCKMAERGQITGGILDGPLAFDNAISEEAVLTKNIHSLVAGHADILVVPDLESGNMLAKQLQYLADAQAAGVVIGARIPIILTSRADSVQTRIASCAVSLLMAHYLKK